MKKVLLMGAIAAAALVAGCSDMKSRLTAQGEFGTQVMDAFRSDGALAARMTDNLLASDSTRAIVIERLFANGDAAQQIMLAIARDRTMLDGVIALAVQDSGTRGHLLTLLKGIEIGDAAR